MWLLGKALCSLIMATSIECMKRWDLVAQVWYRHHLAAFTNFPPPLPVPHTHKQRIEGMKATMEHCAFGRIFLHI